MPLGSLDPQAVGSSSTAHGDAGSVMFCFREGALPEANSELKHLKMDGWKTILSFWHGLFSEAMLVSGRVYNFVHFSHCYNWQSAV